MNFLQIVQKVNKFVGLQGDVDTVTPSSAIQKALVDIVRSCYVDIQLMREDWAWMYVDGLLSWTQASTSYTNSAIAKYKKLYYNKADLIFIPYDTWKQQDYSNSSYQTFPSIFTISPEGNAIYINPADANYVVSYRGYSVPEELSSNTQVPLLPVQHHLAICYKAASEMGSYLGNMEIRNEYIWKYDVALGQLLRSQNLPKQTKMRPIV